MITAITVKELIMFIGFLGTIMGATWKMSSVVNSLKEQIIILQQDVKNYIKASDKLEERVDDLEKKVQKIQIECSSVGA